ncbi:anti-sigma factor [Paenibacillus sp. PK3_47]|uniref:anti-sigma factor n=1 Tax=Paenibacillus sp. PK3_47 TaxID=2072642 RepID=UPI00201E3DCB|nr:anti-sigma factor [Paenibacillus sp. PK3_47]
MTEEFEQESVCELAELYALDALTREEMEKFEDHAEECGDCRKLVSEYRAVLDLLPLGSPRLVPPPGMKARVLSRMLQADPPPPPAEPPIDKEPAKIVPAGPVVKTETRNSVPPKRIPLWRYVSLGLAAAVLGLIIYNGQLRQDVERLEGQAAPGTAAAHELKVNESARLSPGAEGNTASGMATIAAGSGSSHLVVQAENLPEPTGTEVYQVWLIKGDKPQNAGTFVPLDGSGALYYSFQPQSYDTVMITLEPDAGGDTPRGETVLTAPIKNG